MLCRPLKIKATFLNKKLKILFLHKSERVDFKSTVYLAKTLSMSYVRKAA